MLSVAREPSREGGSVPILILSVSFSAILTFFVLLLQEIIRKDNRNKIIKKFFIMPIYLKGKYGIVQLF